MNDRMMAISEIGVSFPDDTFGKESRFGVPFTVIMIICAKLSFSPYYNVVISVSGRMIAIYDIGVSYLMIGLPLERNPDLEYHLP